ncbi:hypothetical protein [Streptomyces sp. CB02923]|nr:hypothetical protein [Streptomyces sp. CB02923]
MSLVVQLHIGERAGGVAVGETGEAGVQRSRAAPLAPAHPGE